MTLLKQKNLKFYVFLLILSLFFTLWVPYVGEEAVYTISAYEMWYHHSYLVTTLYGIFYGRPPLLNWMIIPFAKGLGWQHVLIASRFVSATSSALVATGLWWFVRRLTESSHYALLCAAFYLTGDLLFVRGWLAYADPLLSFFIFFSIAFLWLGVEEEHRDFLIWGVVCLSAGFLVKALSPYWFYGLAGLALLVLHPNRKFLLSLISIDIHLLALAFPLLWNTHADPRYLHAMWLEATNVAFSPSFGKYAYQVLVAQPGLLFVRLAPISLVALFYYFKQVRHKPKTAYRPFAQIAFWIAFLNFAVCWFAPRWPEARYYMPVLPFMAICMAYVVWNADFTARRFTAFFLLFLLVEKALFVGYFYYRYEHHEPNYQAEAKAILNTVGGAPITADVQTLASAPVEKVAIYLDLMRYPRPPIVASDGVEQKRALAYNHPTQNGCRGTYVIGQIPTPRDQIVEQYSSGKRRVYLFCRRVK